MMAVGILLLALGLAMDVDDVVCDERPVGDTSAWDVVLDCTPAGLSVWTDDVVFEA